MTVRTAWTAWLAAVVLCVASTATAQEADDPHVRLRTEIGVSASRGQGEVRLLTEAYLTGGGLTSVVARRGAHGRWTVSRVTNGWGRAGEKRWALSRREGQALDAALDDPVTLHPPANPPPGYDFEVCLDPWSISVETDWRGKQSLVFQSCGPWAGPALLFELVEGRR